MLSDSVTSSRAGTPMPSVAAVPRRSARYRPDADVLSQCESVATDATDASNTSRWSSKSLRFKLRRAGSIRSTSTTQSTHERITALIRHLARSLHVQRKAASPSGASSPFPYAASSGIPHAEHHAPQSRLDDFSVRLGSSAARYGGSNVNAAGVGASPIRPAGPRRLESEDAAAVWADVMKTAHATKGGAEKAAFHHVLRERDKAVQECRRLKSLRGGKQPTSAGQPAVASVRDIHTRLALSVSELQQVTGRKEMEAGDLTTDLKRIAGELAALTRELEQSLARSLPPAGLAKSAEPGPRITSGAGPVVPPSPCSQQQHLQTTLSRQSSVHTLSNPFQSNRIPTPASKDNETARAAAAATELEKEGKDHDQTPAMETARAQVSETEIGVSAVGDMHEEHAANLSNTTPAETTPQSDKPNHVESQPSAITFVTTVSKVDISPAAESTEDAAQLTDSSRPSSPHTTEAWTEGNAPSADNLATSSDVRGQQAPTTVADLDKTDFADEMNGRIDKMFASVAAPVLVPPRPPPRKRTIKRTAGAREPSFDLKIVDVTGESDIAFVEAA